MSIARTSKSNPCPVCKKFHGCGISDKGNLVLCVRVPSQMTAKNGAWMHFGGDRLKAPSVRSAFLRSQQVRSDLLELHQRFQRQINPPRLESLSRQLGLTIDTLKRLGIGWAYSSDLVAAGTKCKGMGAWTFPMRSADMELRGMRLRAVDGFKWAISGSLDGLFIPTETEAASRLFVCEGPTDTAAMIDLGFFAIGRSCATGGAYHIRQFVKLVSPEEVVIVADRDAPGQTGARSLAMELMTHVPVRIIVPPDGVKDARAWKQASTTAADIEYQIDAADVLRIGKVSHYAIA